MIHGSGWSIYTQLEAIYLCHGPSTPWSGFFFLWLFFSVGADNRWISGTVQKEGLHIMQPLPRHEARWRVELECMSPKSVPSNLLRLHTPHVCTALCLLTGVAAGWRMPLPNRTMDTRFKSGGETSPELWHGQDDYVQNLDWNHLVARGRPSPASSPASCLERKNMVYREGLKAKGCGHQRHPCRQEHGGHEKACSLAEECMCWGPDKQWNTYEPRRKRQSWRG